MPGHTGLCIFVFSKNMSLSKRVDTYVDKRVYKGEITMNKKALDDWSAIAYVGLRL